MTRKPVTILEVARAAGVSPQTVSRVLNERPDVAPETRRRVQQAMTDMGYRPNAIARSLIHQRSLTLGVVAMASEFYGPSRTLVAIERQVRRQGYSLLLDFLHQVETENVDRILNRLLSRQVEGIIWAVPEIEPNRSWMQGAQPLPVPVVFLSMHPHPGASVVAIDNLQGGRVAVEHLAAQGCRRIGLISGPRAWWEARERLEGWRQALVEAGLPAEDRQVVEGNWTAESGELGLQRLFDRFPEMDAVFACNDPMALGALKAAREMGRRIPQDLAVVGFDNIPESGYFWPPLTTVDQPLEELGSRAVQVLSQLIDAESRGEPAAQAGPDQSVCLPPRLVVRSSSLRA